MNPAKTYICTTLRWVATSGPGHRKKPGQGSDRLCGPGLSSSPTGEFGNAGRPAGQGADGSSASGLGTRWRSGPTTCPIGWRFSLRPPESVPILLTVNTHYRRAELEYLLQQSESENLFLIDGFRDSRLSVETVYAI